MKKGSKTATVPKKIKGAKSKQSDTKKPHKRSSTRANDPAYKAKIAEYQKKYRDKHKTKLAENQHKKYQENKAEYSERAKEYYNAHKDKIIEATRKYQQDRKNDPEYMARRAEKQRLYRQRHKNDPEFRAREVANARRYNQKLKEAKKQATRSTIKRQAKGTVSGKKSVK